MYTEERERTCGTCRHWATEFEIAVTLPDNGPFGRVSFRRAPCMKNAVEPDAGFGAVVLLGPDSHCQCHADAWEAADDYLLEQEEAADYGVIPGVDFPATLSRPLAARG